MEALLNNNCITHHFELEVEDQYIYVEYHENLNVVSLLYTHIPEKLIGKGAFRLLAESIFNYARNAQFKLIVIDTLFKNYLSSHPEHRLLLNDPAFKLN
jgi:predicted GNAT family acetyltransferase